MTGGESQLFASGEGAGQAERIRQACEQVRKNAPAAGPGWSVVFLDGRGEPLGRYVMASYSQVEWLVQAVAGLGFQLDFRGGTPACDFLFVERAAAGRAVAARPPQPVLPQHKRLPIHQGDLVTEDCGGPVMLVHTISTDLAFCVWFSEEAHVHSGTFSVARLVNVGGARRQGSGASTTRDASSSLTRSST